MDDNRGQFLKKYIAQVRLDLSIAAYTKVPATWNERDYIPSVNKLYFIMEGEGRLKIRDREYYPKPGDLYLMPAGVLQSYGTISENTFGKFWCHFTAAIGDMPLFHLIETPAFVRVPDPETLASIFEQLVQYSRSDELTADLRVQSLLLDLVATFIERSSPVRVNIKSNASLARMNDVLKTIDERLSDHLTVEELAQMVHFHPRYFIRVFKGLTGTSPIQYINRLRIHKAKQQLAFPGKSVSEIAESVGMELAYFSRVFKEYTGYSPTAFRNLYPQPEPPDIRRK